MRVTGHKLRLEFAVLIWVWVLDIQHAAAQEFNIAAAWQTALTRQPEDVSRIASWPRAWVLPLPKIHAIDIPSGNWTLTGSITVPAGVGIWLRGAPPRGGASGNSPLPVTICSPGASSIKLAPGALAIVHHLTLLGSSMGWLGINPLWPQPFQSLGRQPPAGLVMADVVVVVRDCDAFLALHGFICGLTLRDTDVPGPFMEMEADWIYVHDLMGHVPSLVLQSTLVVCSWPPPSLRAGDAADDSVSPSNDPSLPPIYNNQTPQEGLLYNFSMAQLDEDGYPLRPSPGPAPFALDRNTPTCSARFARNTLQLWRALIELQARSSQQVVIILPQNISLQTDPGDTHWLHGSFAIRIYRNVTIMGKQVLTAPITQLDFKGLSHVLWIENAPTVQLRLQQLILAKLPCGPKTAFPLNQIVALTWSISWDRRDINRTSLLIRNSTVVIPPSNMRYFAYWIGIQASPVSSVQQMGAWQKQLLVRGKLEVLDGDHTLFLEERIGFGMRWTNTYLTDLPASSDYDCDITLVVPDRPYFPYTNYTPVYTASQLAAYLHNPPTSILILMNNITMTQDAIVNASSLLPGAPKGGPTLLGPIFETAVQTAENSAVDLRDGVVAVSSPVRLIGWYQGDTVLDFGGLSGCINLEDKNTGQVTLQRLTVTGLGPAAPWQQPQSLANVTALLWPFNFDRLRNSVFLSNVSLLTPQPEFDLLKSFTQADAPAQNSSSLALNSSGSGGSRPAAQPVAFIDTSVAQLQLAYEVGQGTTYTDTYLSMTSVIWNGIDARNIVLTTKLPDGLAGLTLTPVPQGLVLPNPATARSRGSSGQGNSQAPLSTWQIATLAVGSFIGLVLLAGLLVWTWLWVQKQGVQQQADKQLHSPPASSLGRDGDQSRHEVNLLITDSLCTASSVIVAEHVSSAIPSSSTGDHQRHLGAWRPSRSSAETRPDRLAGASSAEQPITATTSGSQGGTGRHSAASGSNPAPDDEIRELVRSQREKTQAGPRSAMSGMEGVTLDQVLGQGSFGVVYKGSWRSMPVAVKVLMFHDSGPAARTARQRAINETAINTLLSHDCICNMYSYDLRSMAPSGMPDDRFSAHYRLYIIQEYCDKGTLSQAIDEGLFLDHRGVCKLVHVLMVGIQIAKGMAYIHASNVIHGDLSSDNIMLKTSPGSPLGFQAKVCDFGLSLFLEGPEHSHISNIRQGTPNYVAPEVLGHGIISREADAFSLGVILWELYRAHVPPWRNQGMIQAVAAQLHRGQLAEPPAQGPSPPGVSDTTTTTTTTAAAADTPTESHTDAAGGAGSGSQPPALVPRPFMLATGNAGSAYPLPPNCPPAYAQLVAACLHPIAKARPTMATVVTTLERLLSEVLSQQRGRPGVASSYTSAAGTASPSKASGAGSSRQGGSDRESTLDKLISQQVICVTNLTDTPPTPTTNTPTPRASDHGVFGRVMEGEEQQEEQEGDEVQLSQPPGFGSLTAARQAGAERAAADVGTSGVGWAAGRPAGSAASGSYGGVGYVMGGAHRSGTGINGMLGVTHMIHEAPDEGALDTSELFSSVELATEDFGLIIGGSAGRGSHRSKSDRDVKQQSME